MKKKLMMLIAAAMCVATVVTVAPTDVKAMYSCSQDIINDANAKIAAYQATYEAAKANEAAALNNLNAVKAAGGSELEITVAGNAYTMAQGQTKWCLDQVNNAKAYLANITGRAMQETAFQEERATLVTLTTLQEAKTAYETAQGQAVNVAEQIKAVQAAIAGYQQQVAAIPVFQAQIDALTVQLNALCADYTAKQAVADAAKATYDAKLAAGGYAYSPANENYWHDRDNARNHPYKCECSFCRSVNPEMYKKIDEERKRIQKEQEEALKGGCK